MRELQPEPVTEVRRETMTEMLARVGDRYARRLLRAITPRPIRMVLCCPCCRHQHVDLGYWLSHPHKTHRCAYCSAGWTPAAVPTVGVTVL